MPTPALRYYYYYCCCCYCYYVGLCGYYTL